MVTTLAFDVIARDRASRSFDKIGKAASGFGTTLKNAGKAGVAGLAILGAGLVASIPKVLDTAASLDLLEKKSKTVFGNQIDQVSAWAKESATAMGLTTRQAVGLAAGFGDLLVPMGFTRKEAAKMSTDVIGLSGALAEWSGGQRTAAEVADILGAALLGERDALQGLGIGISQASVDARLLAKGQEKLTGAAREQAEAIATMELIFMKSKDAQAAFAEGGDTLARRLSESKARLKDLGEELLVKATPALTKLANVVAEHVLPAVERFVTWLSGPGADAVALATLDWTSRFLDFAKFTIAAFGGLTKFFIGWARTFLQQAEFAFGWIPDIGPKISKARDQFEAFSKDVLKNLDTASAKVDDWNNDVDKMKKIITLRVMKKDLDEKLKNARKQLNDKDLTKERRAKLNADISRLLEKKRQAQQAINDLRGRTVEVRLKFTRGPLPGDLIRTGQHGFTSAPRGLTLVGEKGPELVSFRGGERLFTAGQTRSMVSDLGRRFSFAPQDFALAEPRSSPQRVEIHFHAGIVGSGYELRNWLARSIDDLNRQGRLSGIAVS